MRHRLSDVDTEGRTAICAVCGPTTISTKHRCMTVVRQERRRYNQRTRQRQNQAPSMLEWRRTHRKFVDGRNRTEREAAIESQAGRCAICGKETALVGDHNHGTGAPRGMLCIACNSLLGMAYDDPAILQAAIEYLKDWSKRRRAG